MRVLVACEFSGTVRDAFAARGHDAWSCDLLPSERNGQHIQGDVLEILDDGWDLMVAHPVCRRLTNSGVRWFHTPPRGKTVEQMWEEFEEAAEFYDRLRAAKVSRKAIENPVMHPYAKARLNILHRQVVQPWWFGDRAFKATGFELFNLPDLVPTNKLTPPARGTEEHKKWSRVHREPPGPEREKNRSRSFPGMAGAMAEQWG